MKTSLASVIIPVYNGERFLDETIQSILNQHYRPIEIIVVNDGSNDATESVAKKYNEVQYIYQDNQGQTTAMNTGLQASNGEFISFLDSDDILLPEKLSKHIKFLNEYKETDAIISQVKNFKDPSFDNKHVANFKIDESANQIFSTATIRKRMFEKVGSFDTVYKHAKEIDWLFRAKEKGMVIEVEQSIVLLRRMHDSNMSYNTKDKSREYMSAVRSSIIRKRVQKSFTKHSKEAK